MDPGRSGLAVNPKSKIQNPKSSWSGFLLALPLLVFLSLVVLWPLANLASYALSDGGADAQLQRLCVLPHRIEDAAAKTLAANGEVITIPVTTPGAPIKK